MKIELGLPEQRIYTHEELVQRTNGEPSYQFTECIENLFHHAGYSYIDEPSLRVDDRVLIARINGVKIGFLRMLCFPSIGDISGLVKEYGIYKLFVYSPRERDVSDRIKSLGPMTYGYNLFYSESRPDNLCDINWSLYDYATHAYNYVARGKILTHLYRNLSFEGFSLREVLQKKISSYDVDNRVTSPSEFLERCANSDCCVFAPGVSHTGLDRCPIMAMSVGACVIHPHIKAILPVNTLIPGVHYLACKDDFSDLDELIQTPREIKLQIGNNAKVFFKRYLTPPTLVNYILGQI